MTFTYTQIMISHSHLHSHKFLNFQFQFLFQFHLNLIKSVSTFTFKKLFFDDKNDSPSFKLQYFSVHYLRVSVHSGIRTLTKIECTLSRGGFIPSWVSQLPSWSNCTFYKFYFKILTTGCFKKDFTTLKNHISEALPRMSKILTVLCRWATRVFLAMHWGGAPHGP